MIENKEVIFDPLSKKKKVVRLYIPLLDRQYHWQVNRGKWLDSDYGVSDNCISCGLCQKVFSLANLKMVVGKSRSQINAFAIISGCIILKLGKQRTMIKPPNNIKLFGGFSVDFKNGIANFSNTESFLTVFEKYWEKRLNTLNSNLVLNKQLLHGSRMRPILAAWGYYFNSPDEVNGEISEDLLKLCFSLELLHKSSIIIDDLIDQDEKRKGEVTFHTEFGDYKAILFALLLIGKSFENIYSITGDSDTLFGKELAVTLIEMSTGAINELSLSSQDIINIEKINLIINQETTSLIRNSLYFGFSLSANMEQTELCKIVENLGNQFGYLFQILNDLEPFTSAEINENYKGKKNFDIQNNRKNYVVAFLYGIASAKDRKKIEKVIDDIDNSNSEKNLFLLIKSYSICEKILDKAESIQVEIFANLEILRDYTEDSDFIDHFKEFIQDMISVSYSKLGIDKRF